MSARGRHVAGDPAVTADLPAVQMGHHKPLDLRDMCGCGHLARDHSESYGRCTRACGCLLWHELQDTLRSDVEDQLRELLGKQILGVHRYVRPGTQTPVLEVELDGDPYPLIVHGGWQRTQEYVEPLQCRITVAARRGLLRVQFTWLEDLHPDHIETGEVVGLPSRAALRELGWLQ